VLAQFSHYYLLGSWSYLCTNRHIVDIKTWFIF